jgi:hypothetical protein
MIHHASFGVRDPHRVASVLAELVDATPLPAPTPPFPYGAWLVLSGDAQGSFLEILPAATVFDPDAPLGMRQRPATFDPVTTHVLVSATADSETIHAAAGREGWRTQEVETGLFRIVKLWIDGNVLVELLPKGEEGRYLEAFGATGLPTLEGKFRDLQAKLASALSQKLPPQMLAEALGTPLP